MLIAHTMSTDGRQRRFPFVSTPVDGGGLRDAASGGTSDNPTIGNAWILKKSDAKVDGKFETLSVKKPAPPCKQHSASRNNFRLHIKVDLRA